MKVNQNNILIVKSVKLIPNTIDKLPDRLFTTISQYFFQHIDLFSIEFTNKIVILHLGKIISNSDETDLSVHFNLLSQHSHHILPSTLTIKEISGYHQQISSIDRIDITKNYIRLNNSFIKIFDFSELKITDFHSKIPRLILEIPNTSIFFSFSKFSGINYHFSIQLKSYDQKSLNNFAEVLISNLKRTPYFSGKLNVIGQKSFRKSPGKNLIGITSNSISQTDFNSFLELIPASLTYAKIIPIPEILPKVKVSQPINNIDTSDKLIFSEQIHPPENGFKQESNDSTHLLSNKENILFDFPFVSRIMQHKWKILSFSENSKQRYLVVVQNEKIVLKVEIDTVLESLSIVEVLDDIINIL